MDKDAANDPLRKYWSESLFSFVVTNCGRSEQEGVDNEKTVKSVTSDNTVGVA